MRAADLELSRHDLVAFAVPSAGLPAAVAAHARPIPRRAGVLVMSKGLVPPLGTLASAFVAERVHAWAVGALAGPAHAADALSDGASLVLGARDPAFARQVADALTAAGFDVGTRATSSASSSPAAPRTPPRSPPRPPPPPGPTRPAPRPARCSPRSTRSPATRAPRPRRSPASPAPGDLVATVMAEGSRNRRAGEMLAEGMPAEDIDSALGQTAEAVACVPLLAERVQAAGVDAPTLRGLAGVIEGELDAAEWTESLTAPRPTPKRPQKVRAA